MQEKSNRLIKEKSPYLLQHAHNPVDWYPWSREAFDAAKKQDKPIFLSIGYATCHWCHVMEKESFENEEIASILNDTFINIKVDREELPQVDNTYMEFAQALMSSSGGWPLNLVLTPDLKPFFAVTYLPPQGERGMTGLKQFATHIRDLWRSEQKSLLIEQAEKIVSVFARSVHTLGNEIPTIQTLIRHVETLLDVADPVYGGIRGEPKFPMGYQIEYLLEFAREHNESRTLFYSELTLDMMARGGIFDQLGGGFSRYAVDQRWEIPHFEKMLYDNAILAKSYLEAYKMTQNAQYETICRETLDYLLNEMMGPNGEFYSAEDADTEGREGFYYTWTHEEVMQVLPPEEAELFCHYYGMRHEGNFEGRNCLNIPIPLRDFAEGWSVPEEELADHLLKMREKLLEARKKRTRPLKDDKVITSWNAIAIDTFIRAGYTLNEQKYSDAALKCLEFIEKNLLVEDRLFRRYRDGEARFSACLEDYALMIRAYLTLFQIKQEARFLKRAIAFADLLEQEFKADKGAFYQVNAQETCLLRKCDFYDGAEPSGNGVHAENLLRLYQITQNKKFLAQAEDVLKAAKLFIESYPPGSCYLAAALQRYWDEDASTMVIFVDEKQSYVKELQEKLQTLFNPHLEVVWVNGKNPELFELLPYVADKKAQDGITTVYICRQNQCRQPLNEIKQIIKALDTI